MPRIIFAGTPAFAGASLAALLAADVVPLAVLTQPDRPAGRGKRLAQSAVKQLALEHELPLMQPATLRDPAVVAELAALQPELIIVAAYGLLLPQAVLDLPASGCLNVHASLLPRWRGAAPIQAAILAGDAETGVCLMQMTAGLDSGPVFASAATAILPGETAGELHDRLAALGAELLVARLPAILAGELIAVAQDETRVTHAGKIRRDDARMAWDTEAAQIVRAVRAYNPVPGAWFELDGDPVKCWAALPGDAVDAAPGTVVSADRAGIVVACRDASVALQRLQRPGRKPVSAGEFAAQLDLVGRQL